MYVKKGVDDTNKNVRKNLHKSAFASAGMESNGIEEKERSETNFRSWTLLLIAKGLFLVTSK